jgi:hypothetical protein
MTTRQVVLGDIEAAHADEMERHVPSDSQWLTVYVLDDETAVHRIVFGHPTQHAAFLHCVEHMPELYVAEYLIDLAAVLAECCTEVHVVGRAVEVSRTPTPYGEDCVAFAR